MSDDPTPDYKPGDIVNGHRLDVLPDGTQAWVPLDAVAASTTPKRKWYTRKAVIVPAAIVLGLIVISSIARGGSRDDGTAQTLTGNDKPGAVETAEPAKQVLIPDVAGMTPADAIALLSGAGFYVPSAGEDAISVTGTNPAVGTTVDAGSTVILIVEKKPALTLAQENAVGSAQDYLAFKSFSRQGLIDQLSSQYGSGYPVDVATWAVDYLNVDWNDQAAKAAKEYLDFQSFSRQGLYEQLTSAYGSQFTPEQANAGLAAVGY